MERLAKAVQLAAKYHEESYKVTSPIEIEGVSIPQGEYTVSLWDASERAAAEVGFDQRGTMPVYLLLQKECWNDALAWADEFEPVQPTDTVSSGGEIEPIE